MRRGKLARANEISLKLGTLIKEARSQHMSNLANADTKRLWQAVNGKRGNGQDNICSNIGTVDQFNSYFAGVANDPCYNRQEIEKMIVPTPTDFDPAVYSSLEPFEVERMLASLKRTSPGPSSPPCWVLKQCSVELADPVCKLLNLSFSTGNLPAQWLTSIVTPVLKCPSLKLSMIFDLYPLLL